MVYDRIYHLKLYNSLSPLMSDLEGFIIRNDLNELDNGEHKISGEDLFVRVMEYETVAKDASVYESHRDYLDLHLILKGREVISCLMENNLTVVREYSKEDDTVLFKGKAGKKLHMDPGDFLLLFPHEAHAPSLAISSVPEKVRKAVFKLRFSSLY